MPPQLCSPFGSALPETPQDVLHDPAVAVVARLARGVDAYDGVELLVPRRHLDRPRGGPVVQLGYAAVRERLVAGEAERLGVLALGVLRRQHAHADEVRAVDPLVGLRDDRVLTQQRGALGGP